MAQVAEGGENLSVGQRQLVCLTRWIEICQKKIVDEPVRICLHACMGLIENVLFLGRC